MNFDLSDEQKLLRDEARDLLSERASYERVRKLLDSGTTWDRELWADIARLGWLGAAIPEEFGGSGLTAIELCVLAHEIGRRVAPVPFFSSIGLAAYAIQLAGTPDQKARYLPRLASGELIGTLAWSEGPGFTPGQEPATQLSEARLTGRKWPVPDVQAAHFAIVTALERDGPVLALTHFDQPHIALSPLVGIDVARSHFSLEMKSARAERLGAAGVAPPFAEIFDRAAALAAFEQVGGAEAALEMAVAYVLERRTFGRSVGSYQAVKHKLATLWVELELARSNAYYAAWAMSSAGPELPLAAATARVSASEAYSQAAEESLHLHGGIGYTWEADCHFHYRRARLLSVSLGSRAYWSDRLLEHLTEKSSSLASIPHSRSGA